MSTSQNITTAAEGAPSRGWIARLGTIGDRPEDSAEERLRHSLLIYIGVLMSRGGLLWGGLATYYGRYLPAIIPFGYTAATIVNLSYFYRSKSFVRVRFVQGEQEKQRLSRDEDEAAPESTYPPNYEF